MKVVLDASALLAFLYEETGQEQVAAVIDNATISSVNLSEVIAKLTKDGFPTKVIDNLLLELPLTVLPFDHIMAYHAGLLIATTSKWGLSLGDRACLATAKILGIPAMTADTIWEKLPVEWMIICIRSQFIAMKT